MSRSAEEKDKKRKLGAASFIGGSALGTLGVYLDSVSNRYVKPQEMVDKAERYDDKIQRNYDVKSPDDLIKKIKDSEDYVSLLKNKKDGLTEFEKLMLEQTEERIPQMKKAHKEWNSALKYLNEHKKGQTMKDIGRTLKYGAPSVAILGAALYLLNRDKNA